MRRILRLKLHSREHVTWIFSIGGVFGAVILLGLKTQKLTKNTADYSIGHVS